MLIYEENFRLKFVGILSRIWGELVVSVNSFVGMKWVYCV